MTSNNIAVPFQIDGRADGAPKAPYCRRCGGEAPVHAGRCPACQSFLPGNREAVTHGVYARRLPEDLRVSIEEFRDDVVSAQGGLEALGHDPLRAELVRTAVDFATGRRLWMNQVVRVGVDTKAGREAYDRLLATADRLFRAVALLGLGRRAKDVTSSPIDFMRGADV